MYVITKSAVTICYVGERVIELRCLVGTISKTQISFCCSEWVAIRSKHWTTFLQLSGGLLLTKHS